MWDQKANGYARGDGVAACILKTLSQAIADGDHIECIIRETGLNQDGATNGITMPSATAQTELIESTYARAGLDLSNTSDRPQFFEAHGTGTPAGDPIEAEAIAKAFYGKTYNTKMPGDPLYVGSIKTILGHTEGTAGVAALLKASLALQHSVLPPNMLLDNMSSTVIPFATNLEILKKGKAWPVTIPGQPRRASVNSFGFGGANAHAILESYEASSSSVSRPRVSFSPIVFSALSRQSLRRSLLRYIEFFEANLSLNLRDLAYTLQQRRSALPYRISFGAESMDDLIAQMKHKLESIDENELGFRLSHSVAGRRPRSIGIFTGQGSQYVRMGAELLEKSETARRIVQQLQADLEALPEDLRPDFSIEEELCAAGTDSHVLTGEFSFLSTTIQILLVDLLKLAGVSFDAIVAHSSGEMAAAYAAGRLSRRDCMRVAYFRGRFASKMVSPNGPNIKGAMLAAGMSEEDAESLCEDPVFSGKVCVAAVNSSSSVTLSGDEEAIDEFKILLDDEAKFNRKLRVDKAYHSNHVLKHLPEYVDLIKRADVRALEPGPDAPLWISSVYAREATSDMEFSDNYWGSNVARSVKFYQSLKVALEAGPYDFAIEVGPHPALKGPATQTIDEILGKGIPYFGVLSRGLDATATIATSLGSIWSQVGGQHLDLTAYEIAMSNSKLSLNLLKGLPSYQWNHDSSYSHESRSAKKLRSQTHLFNELLGSMTPDSASHRLSWGHLLRASELDWIAGHQVQSQTVFPAAGYICTAFEGARVLAGDREVKLFELRDFVIHQALTFPNDDAGIDVQTALSGIETIGHDHVRANFSYSASNGEEDMNLVAEGELHIMFGDSSEYTLPQRQPMAPHMISVDHERFYSLLATLGYGFDGCFKSLHTLRRKLGRSNVAIKSVSRDVFGKALLVHPAEIDGGIQSLILSFSYPDDDQLLNMHLPTNIKNIRVNPALCQYMTGITADSVLSSSDSPGFRGDVGICTSGSSRTAIQMEGVELRPLGGLTAKDDRKVFSKYEWTQNSLDGNAAACDTTVTQHHQDVLEGLERIATYYLHKLDADVPDDSPLRKKDSQHNHYLRYARHIMALIRSDNHVVAKKAWLNDTLDDLRKSTAHVTHLIDYDMMHLVGQQMPRVMQGKTQMIEEMRVSNILDNYYTGAFGSREAGLWIGRTVAQLSNRYPHLNILEVGAGTGGATTRILEQLDSKFLSYTFTDLSSGFFEKASEQFAAHKDRMTFKTFDCGADPVTQGYIEGQYDVVVAFLVIHATPDLELTMRNIRKLLKPGGFLVVGEGTNNGQPCGSAGFIFGSLSGWWLGHETGRPLSPFVSYDEWERLLKCSGFSGIDSTAPQEFQDILGMTVFAAQAVDDKVNLMREPLNPAVQLSRSIDYPMTKMVIIGGDTSMTTPLAEAIKLMLEEKFAQVHSFKRLTSVEFGLIDADTTIVSLSEIDKPVYQDLDPEEWEAFRTLFTTPAKLFWVTSGRLDANPFSNMTVGFARTAVFETPALRFQNIEIPDLGSITATGIVERVMRFHFASSSEQSQLDWPLEPEVLVNSEGRELVPRLRHIAARNDRYNSARRAITHDLDIAKFPASLVKNSEGWRLQELSRWAAITDRNSEQPQLRLEISHTVQSAIRTPYGHQFLVTGTETRSRIRFLALVPRLVSVVHISENAAIPMAASELNVGDQITTIACGLVSMALVDIVMPGDALVVYNAPGILSSFIEDRASRKGVRVAFIADSAQKNIPDHWTKLEPYMTQSETAKVLPADTTCFIDLSIGGSENAAAVHAGLPLHCRRETISTIFSSVGWGDAPSSSVDLRKYLERALDTVSETCVSEIVAIDDFTSGRILENPLAVIDWSLSKKHPCHVSRLDSAPFFKADKTYWLCGLSGALGVSLADWMIEQGARTLVLTSRNPNISPDWIDDHKRNGINAIIVPCDVTDETALRAAHKHIAETRPPIAGVLNGAMVLRDVSIQNMSYDLMTDVYRPKVYGSMHLDRIFENSPLDFFILFSSINCVIGNLGQANYAAANTFMCALAAQRRKRGLAATALNVGAIIGAGYMERESSKALDLTVSKMALMHLSEQDYHQLFAEGIDSGRPDSEDEAELTTGLLDIPAAADFENVPRWHANPAFLDFIVHQVVQNGAEAGSEIVASVQDQLASCKSGGDVIAIVKSIMSSMYCLESD